MNELQAITFSDLEQVSGGADPGAGPNRFSAEGTIKANGYGVSVEGQGKVETARTDYGLCLDKATSAAERKDCLPLATPRQ